MTPCDSRSKVAVFICSSDGRKDILDRVLPSVQKFWVNCPYPIYVGLNSCAPLQIGSPVLAPTSEWYRECTLQLEQLSHEYLIVILDDFLIRATVNQTRLEDLVQIVTASTLDYVRLVPVGRSLLERVVGRRSSEFQPGVEQIRAGRPFYSALQIAIWRRAHLQTMLKSPLSIWEFEHKCLAGSVHYAVRERPPFFYRHLVERGRWLPDAKTLLRKADLPADLGTRPVWPNLKYAGLVLDHISWVVRGYATC